MTKKVIKKDLLLEKEPLTQRDNTKINNTLTNSFVIREPNININDILLSNNPMGFFPIIGDILQVGDIALDVYRDNYKKAITNAGLLLVPNILEKTGKFIGKGIKQIIKNNKDKYIKYINESIRKELFPKTDDIYYHMDNLKHSRANTNKKLHPSEDSKNILPGEARDKGDTPYIWFSKGQTYGRPKQDRIVVGSKDDLNLIPIQNTELPHNEIEGFYVTKGYENTNNVKTYQGIPIDVGGNEPVYVYGKEIFYTPKKDINNQNEINLFKMGGKQKQTIYPNIIRGGAAIPLGDNIYLLKGKKHSQGGIDIGKDLEAEGDEVIKMNPKSIKVVTAQKIMGGKSPAELVVNASSTGEQEEVFNDVFKYQERFKDRNNLNDDGTKKAEFGKEVKDFNDKMLYNPKQKKEIKIQPPLEIGQKHLKQRNYIGGKPDEARRKALNMMPKVKSHIEQLAKTYGIDKNVLTHRFLKEGWVDDAIKEYNTHTLLGQKNFFDRIANRWVDGYWHMGLDDAGTHIAEGKYNLRREIPYYTTDAINEKDRPVISISTDNLYDALEIKAADMEYRQNELRKRGISEEDMNTYLNAAYNMGLYHKDLNNKDYINKNYKVPNYYKLGGMKQFKDRKKAANGGAWASLIAEYGAPAIASNTQLINAGLKFPVDLGSVIGANIYTKKQLDKIKEATLDYNTETYNAQTTYNKEKYDKLNELLDKYYKEDLADLEKHKIVRKDAVYSPVKLKTRININPQLQQIQRERDRNIRSIVENTASSKDALNRIRLENLEARDKNIAIQGQKENIETQLINQDLLQRKATIEKQVDANLRLDELRAQDLMTYYNNLANLKKGYNQNKLQSTLKNLEDVFNTENLKRTSDFNAESSYRQGRMENRMNLIQGISDSVGQLFSEVNNSAMTAAKLQIMQNAYGNNKVNPQTSFSPVGIQDPSSQYFGNSAYNSVNNFAETQAGQNLIQQILANGYNFKLGGKTKIKRRK